MELYATGVRSRKINNINGLTMHVLEAGYENSENKPCIVLLHGFPELAYSWRKLLIPLANAGYYVIAPDQRGYGYTEGWKDNYEGDISEFEMTNLVKDIVSLIFSLGKKSIDCLVGHDFGSIVAAHATLIRPDIFKSVVLMSAPFDGVPTINYESHEDESIDIHKEMASLSKPRKHYQWYYSTDQANNDMMTSKQGLKNFLRAYYHVKSADWKNNVPFKLNGWKASELEKLPGYYVMDYGLNMAEQVNMEMPSEEEIKNNIWLENEELEYYFSVYSKTGFQGGLNWYRCMIDSNFRLRLEIYSGLKITVPSLFIAGNKDWGIYQKPNALENMQNIHCPKMQKILLIENAGHWVQQEKPEEVIEALLSFISTL